MKALVFLNVAMMSLTGCATAKLVDVTWYNQETGEPASAAVVGEAKRVCKYEKTMKEARLRLANSVSSGRVRTFHGSTGERSFFDKSEKTLRKELYQCLEEQGISSDPAITSK